MTTYPISSYAGVTRSIHTIPAVIQDELWVSEQCREAINCLERALLAPPLQLTREVAAAVRRLTQLRTRVSDWLRLEKDTGQDWKMVLAHLDSALDLLQSVSYPTAGVRRKPVEQARQHLQSILNDGLF